MKATGCSPGEALLSASLHPAKVLGLAKTQGTLNHGARADIVILDTKLNVQATFIGGELVWCRHGSRISCQLDN